MITFSIPREIEIRNNYEPCKTCNSDIDCKYYVPEEGRCLYEGGRTIRLRRRIIIEKKENERR